MVIFLSSDKIVIRLGVFLPKKEKGITAVISKYPYGGNISWYPCLTGLPSNKISGVILVKEEGPELKILTFRVMGKKGIILDVWVIISV
jgi:hypothetical protein